MKQGWEIKAFDDCIEKVKVKTKLPSSSYQKEGAFPIVSQEKELISGYWDNEEDVITLSTPATIFGDHTMVVKYIDFDFVVGADGVKILKPKSFLNPKYFYYWVRSADISSRGYARHYRYLREKIVSIPSLAEQERIVEILDREFERIDALKANAEQNLQHAKDLFQSALKQELQPQDKWIKSTIGETCILKSGNSNANHSSVGTLPFVKVGDMNIEGNEESITCSSTYVSHDENIKGIFPVGSVIFPKRGGAILTNKKRITTTDICCDLNIMGVYSKGEIISELLYLYFLGVDLSQIYNGAAIPQINNGDIAPLHISFPKDVAEQQYIVAKLNKLRLNCKAVEENYTKTMALCDDMKQALLRQAFNGEL